MPKRAPSAYNLFIRDTMPELRKKTPGKPIGEYMKLASAKWKNASDSVKQEYDEKAKLAKQAWEEQQKERESSEDAKGAFHRLHRAITTMRSSPKKNELQTCLRELQKYI